MAENSPTHPAAPPHGMRTFAALLVNTGVALVVVLADAT